MTRAWWQSDDEPTPDDIDMTEVLPRSYAQVIADLQYGIPAPTDTEETPR